MMRLRRAGGGDARALSLVGAATFLETYALMLSAQDILEHCATKHSAVHYAEWLADPAWRLWLAEVDPGGAPIGYIASGPVASPIADLSPDDVEVHRIYVLSKFHGTGVGAQLMQAACAESAAAGARRALLGVNKQNQRALAFYAKAGFSVVGERKFMVGAIAHDDFVLARPLAP